MYAINQTSTNGFATTQEPLPNGEVTGELSAFASFSFMLAVESFQFNYFLRILTLSLLELRHEQFLFEVFFLSNL